MPFVNHRASMLASFVDFRKGGIATLSIGKEGRGASIVRRAKVPKELEVR